MNFRPLHDRVVVKRLEGEEKTKGASSFRTPPRRSPRRARLSQWVPGGRDESGKLTPLDVKTGDKVLFGKWSGTEVKIDGDRTCWS